MARVPTIQRQVRPAALPDVRQSFVPGPASFGAGTLTPGISDLVQVVSKQHQQAQDDADQAALLEFDNTLAGYEHNRLHDPQTGVLNTVKGKEALDLPNTIGDEYDQLSSEAISNLQPRQQLAGQRLAQRRREGIISTLDSYGSRENDAYNQQQVEASLKTSVQLGIANATDPQRLKTELDRQALIVTDTAQKQGLPPELRDQKIGELRTATLSGSISQLLTLGKDQAARVLFDETKHQIDGDAWPKIEAALEESSTRRQAQVAADAIGAKATTLTEARDAVKAIDDPKLRDAVQQRVEHDWQVKETIDRQAHEDAMKSAANLIDNGQKIPSSLWVSLTVGERSALEAYQKRNQLAADPEGKTDLPTYYGLMTQSSTHPDDFAKLNLLMYLPKLAKTEFKQLAEIQSSIRKGDTNKADSLNNDFRTVNEIVTDQLHTAGIATSGSDADQAVIARVHNAVAEQGRSFKLSTGKEPTKADYEKMSSDLISRAVLVPGGFWAGVLHPFTLNVTGKRLIELTADDVPAADRAQIEQALQKAGRAVSDESVLQVYIASQTKGKK